MMKAVKLILKIILVVFILMVVLMIATIKLFGDVNNKEQKKCEKMIPGGTEKALILYQDSRGNTVEKKVNEIVAKVSEKGYSITLNHPRADLDYQVADYDVIILVTPIYAGTLSKPLMNFADSQDFSGKKVYGLITGRLEDQGEIDAFKSHIKNAETVVVEKQHIHELEAVLQ